MEETIRTVLGNHGKLPVDIVSLTEHDDLYAVGLTSHATVNIMLALEDAFDVEFPDSMLRKSTFTSVAAIRAALVEIGAS